MKEIFILDAQATLPDGTVQALNAEEAQALMQGKGLDGQTIDVTITWLEGTPEQIFNILCGSVGEE